MFANRATWARLTKGGIPPLFVLRPKPGEFTPPNIGDEYHIKDLNNKFEVLRAKQLYQQKNLGTEDECVTLLAKCAQEGERLANVGHV